MLAIRETTGDIFAADVEALVNPVNTVGVMGAGLALQFKRRYPRMFTEYVAVCQSGELRPGTAVAHITGIQPQYIISFPTKQHWRQPSKLEWIHRGLIDLAETIQSLPIRSIAIPALGCGLGGLNWVDVRGLIEKHLGDLSDVDVVLYVPKE